MRSEEPQIVPLEEFVQKNIVSSQEIDVRALYGRLLDNWNLRHAADFSGYFSADGETGGFDGRAYKGCTQIESALAHIFAHPQTPAYIEIVRNVRFLTTEVAVLSAVVGMVPPGQSDINPVVNAIQRLVALKEGNQWRVALFQNTPAAYHGQPELSESLTAELRQAQRMRRSSQQ